MLFAVALLAPSPPALAAITVEDGENPLSPMAVEYNVLTVVATIPAYSAELYPPVKETALTLSTAVPSVDDVPTVSEIQGDYEKGSAYGRFLSISSFNNKSKYRKASRKIPICGYFSVSAMSILYCKKQGDG
jgi:hypothetical protein